MTGPTTTAADHGIAAGSWTIDPAHSAVAFTVRHLMSKVRGRFDEFTGTITTGTELTDSRTTATIDLASVNTGNDMRDKDLRSPRFFNVTEHPRMTFTSTCVRQHGQQWIISGELSINDVTRPVDIDTEFLGVDDTGLQGETRIGFSGRTAIRRSEFGLDGLTGDGTKIIVGDVVALELDIEAVLNQ